jgi:hypothetical protein
MIELFIITDVRTTCRTYTKQYVQIIEQTMLMNVNIKWETCIEKKSVEIRKMYEKTGGIGSKRNCSGALECGIIVVGITANKKKDNHRANTIRRHVVIQDRRGRNICRPNIVACRPVARQRTRNKQLYNNHC